MTVAITIHYDNGWAYRDPHLWIWYDETGSLPDEFAPTGRDTYGSHYTVSPKRPAFNFKFKDGPGTNAVWENDALNRHFPRTLPETEIWCRADKAFIYDVPPRTPESINAADFLGSIAPVAGIHVPDTDGASGLGATPLAGGGTLFGLYQPNAARVYVCGTFNDWQRPGHPNPDPARYHELKLYRGYFGQPNLWLGVVPEAAADDEYKFLIRGGVPSNAAGRFEQWATDPFARRLGQSFADNNSVVVDPSTFTWDDAGFSTPDRSELILYELSVYGFTEGDSDITAQGRFAGITERIGDGYFNKLGVTALSLMPLAESSDIQSPTALGYSTSIFSAIERDFGTPDDLRDLVNQAHTKNLTVILDQVFNHTSNGINPMWRAVLEDPREQFSDDGGLYFNGSTPWGNRVATEKRDVQNLLIDVCKMFLIEYHIDGFRFDATHTNYMDHGFLIRLADELTRFKPSTILIAENLPNQADLNRSGYDGYSQWSDPFHDKMKALLREGTYADNNYFNTDRLGDIFFFARSIYAAHTNNVVNYVESHDETSVAFEVGTNPATNQPATKDRKGRLGLFASITALGQPMIYMGQEFNVERDRNIVSFTWPPGGPDSNGFYRWASRLIPLRRRYPALRITGANPAADGRFTWILGPWLDDQAHGRDRKVLGWRLHPNQFAPDAMVVLLNFEPIPARVDLELGLPGTWVKMATSTPPTTSHPTAPTQTPTQPPCTATTAGSSDSNYRAQAASSTNGSS